MRTAATRQPRRPRDGRNQNQGVNAAFPVFVVQGPGEQELECNDPWDSRILSLEDLAHPARADRFDDLIVKKLLARLDGMHHGPAST